MSTALCRHCGELIYPVGDTWEAERGVRACHSGPDDLHVPELTGREQARQTVDTLRKKISEGSSVSYCAGCQNSFPSSQGLPHTQNGDTLIYCPRCSDSGEVFGKEDGLSVSAHKFAGSPALDLECDQCGEEVDVGDDNDIDPMGGPGDPCLNCGHGKLKIAKSPGMTTQDTFEDESLLQADDQSALTPGIAEDMYDAINAPRSFKPPRSMTREQVSGLDKNGDGIYPRSHKIASYESYRDHLVSHHNFRNNWLQGYNEKDLLKIYDQAHKHGAYACDHDHPISDYEHGNMITSSKLYGNVIMPEASYWKNKYPKSITLVNLKNVQDFSPMDPYSERGGFGKNYNVIEHSPGEFDGGIWHYKDADQNQSNHGTYHKFYGTIMHKGDTNVPTNAQAILTPSSDSGAQCLECGQNHGWKWELHGLKRLPGYSHGIFEPLYSYDKNGNKTKIEGCEDTRRDAALQADQSHIKEFVGQINESDIDFY